MHRLPLGAALAFGRVLGRLTPYISSKHYRRVLADISGAFGDRYSPDELTGIARRFYQRLGESLVEFLRLPSLSADEIRRWTRLEGTEHLEAALAQGNGAILLSGHVGNWELCGTLMGLSAYPTTAIARPQMDTALTEFFNRTREAHGLKVVSMTDVRNCLRVLKRNECLGVIGDVNANTPGAFVQFLGRPAATYTGVAYMALTLGSPILPLFDTRLPDHSHCIRIGPPIPPVNTGDRPRDLLLTTMRAQYVIQQEIRRRPEDWFWLLGRWRTRPDDLPNPERIPMESRDLTAEEAAEVLRF